MKYAIMFVATLFGCNTQSAEPQRGNQELGISAFRSTETADRLELDGVDEEGAVVATLRLRVGHVDLPEDGLAGLGREMVVTVNGITANHASVGMTPLSFPKIDEPTLSRFFADPYVSQALGGWGIAISDEEPVVDDTVDYSHSGSCTGFIPACSGTQYTSCCLQHADGSGNQHQTVVCGNLGNRATRSCKGPGQSTACGTAGSAGCAVCMTWSIPSLWTVETSYDGWNDVCGFSMCAQPGGSCSSQSDCCGGYPPQQHKFCDIYGDETCKSCRSAGSPCDFGNECCSQYCDTDSWTCAS